ncbi:MAG TPA: substrate-binding domain-containing protein [Polyangiaceae bacterium]|nr:substrate-binding domain-containing protein [Polyangiaceae bacterium]
MQKTIAVLIARVDHVDDGYEAELRRAFASACAARQLSLCIVVGRALGESPHDRVYRLIQRGSVDGVILVTSGLAAHGGLAAVERLLPHFEGLPLCSFGVRVPGVPSVVIDNSAGMRSAVEHAVLSHSIQRPVFIGGPDHDQDASERAAACRAVLGEYGLELPAEYELSAELGAASAQVAMRAFLARGLPFDAVLAVNDNVAVGASAALKEAGLRLPQAACVIGFDDLPSSRFSNPRLTTVRQPLDAMAERAVDLVLTQALGKSGVSAGKDEICELPLSLLCRASCGCQSSELETRRRPHSAHDPAVLLEAEAQDLLRQLSRAFRLPQRESRAAAELLLRELARELSGQAGAFIAALERLMSQYAEALEIYEELQGVINLLRARLRSERVCLEDLWHTARGAISSASTAEQARRRWSSEAAHARALASADRLSTAFDWASLKAALSAELTKVARNAFISLYASPDERELRPFFCLSEGRLVEPRATRFRASSLLPPGEPCGERCHLLYVFPLTFEHESLGVMVFELLPGVGTREILREQIGAALKSVALHREIVNKTALHERSVQEREATARRMASLSVLAGGVAHDLNNALGPLVALPDILLTELDRVRDGASDVELRQDIETIRTSALRATQTIKDLLALGRQGRTAREPLDLNQTVTACLAAESQCIDRAAQRGVRVEPELEAESLWIRASDAQLVRAVSNLLRNAIEATEGPGLIRIRTSSVRLLEPLSGYETIEPGDYARVVVSDPGKGIEPADLARVFEPFFTRKRLSESSGTGLGLAIVHGVVKEHEGFVNVESRLGVGTQFTLYFRLTPDRPRPLRRRRPSGPRGARILVVDDDPVQLRTAERVLSRLGYQVSTSQSGKRSFQRFSDELGGHENESPYDLVIMDVLLNEEDDGLTVFERMQTVSPAQRGIVVSGHAPTERVKRAISQGLAWLEKPYGADELAQAVQSALERPAPNASSALGAGGLGSAGALGTSGSTAGRARVAS